MQRFLILKVMNSREKIVKIMESEGMSSKQFADEIGIQAGTISNIVNGRNNPSLEVMQKVLNRFRTISSDWLVLNIGTMYRPNGAIVEQQALFDIKPLETEGVAVQPVVETKKEQPQNVTAPKEIEKIVIFFTDGTFEER